LCGAVTRYLKVYDPLLTFVAGQSARLGGAHVVHRVVHLGDDMEAVEDVDRLAAAFADHLQIGLPHVRAAAEDLAAPVAAQHRAGRDEDGRQAGADRAHQQQSDRLP